MSGEIVLIRHAETDLAGRFCGHSDPPLNDKGIRQLPALVERLAAWKYDFLYSSDLLRARQTATAIVDNGDAPVQLRKGLREIFFGEWEGLSWQEIERRDDKAAKLWIEEYPYRSAPNGEDYRSFTARIKSEADFLFEEARGRRLAVVTHAGVIRAILGLRCGLSDQQAWQWAKDYGTIIVVSTQGGVLYTSAEKACD